MTEWKIGSWCWWLGNAVFQWENTIKPSQVALGSAMTIDVARIHNPMKLIGDSR